MSLKDILIARYGICEYSYIYLYLNRIWAYINLYRISSGNRSQNYDVIINAIISNSAKRVEKMNK